MTVATTNEEVAQALWKAGLHRFPKHFPAWSFDAPDFAGNSLVFGMRSGTRQFRVRVENADGRGEGFLVGPSLKVRVVENEGAGEIAEAFAEAILRIDRAGRAIKLPAGDPNGSWRELFIADACNLRCTFCCESVRIGRGKMMPWDQISRVLHSYAESGVKVVQFMGGEPSIHPRFADALRLSHQLGMRNYAITNLLKWRDRAFAEEVGPLLDELMISMHAVGDEAGDKVTGRRYWWERFQVGVANARETLTGRVYGATVLSKNNVADLEIIAATLAGLGASKWVMGNSVPIAQAPLNSLQINLDLDDQRAQMDRFKRLHAWTAERGCEMVFFCMPDCVLRSDLWAASHDRMLHDQDLLGTATATAGEEVNFWSRTDFQEAPVRNVALGRRYADVCEGCTRRGSCGGYFDEYLQAKGSADLRPFQEPVATPAIDVPPVSAAVVFERSFRRLPERISVSAPLLRGRSLVARYRIADVAAGEVLLTPAECRADAGWQGHRPDFGRRLVEVASTASKAAWPSFPSGKRGLIMVSGVPRSGTSWVARIAQNLVASAGIERSLGNRAGQRMDDFPTNAEGDAEYLRLQEAVGCFVQDGHGIHVLKTHYEVGPDTDAVRTLYIFREPLDVMTSTFFYAQGGPAAEHFAERSSHGVLSELLDSVLPQMLRSYELALAAGPSALLLDYRDLVDDGAAELARIAEHIGLSLPSGFAEAAARAHSFENEAGRPAGQLVPHAYYRSGVPDSWRDSLPSELHGTLLERTQAVQARFTALARRARELRSVRDEPGHLA